MIQKNWQIIDPSIINPESTYYNAEANVIFVSNVVGDELTKDGQGWISRVSVDGQIIDAKWVEGLNAPHGMRAYQGKLWVADIDELVEIDLQSGNILSKIPIPGSAFLNDVAISDDGRVFVSDTLKNRIYLVDRGKVTTFAKGKHLQSPNGLLIEENKLFVAGWGNIINDATFETDVPGNVFALDIKSQQKHKQKQKQKQTITQAPLGNLDGIEQDLDGNFLVSDYTGGKLFVVNSTNGEPYELISDLEGPADIGFIPDNNLIIVPSLSQSTVTAYQYKPTLSLSEENPTLLELDGDTDRAKVRFRLGSKDVDSSSIDQGRINSLFVAQLQGQSQRELIDLRNFTGEQLQITFSLIEHESVYDNTLGFYRVEDKQGRVIDPLTSVEFKPGEAGYIQTALRNSQQFGISFAESSDDLTGVLSGGHLYAPFLIANDNLEHKLASLGTNSNDDSFVYFSYLGANEDGADHVRLLGDNTWGFEDSYLGGDRDFNDVVVQAEFSLI